MSTTIRRTASTFALTVYTQHNSRWIGTQFHSIRNPVPATPQVRLLGPTKPPAANANKSRPLKLIVSTAPTQAWFPAPLTCRYVGAHHSISSRRIHRRHYLRVSLRTKPAFSTSQRTRSRRDQRRGNQPRRICPASCDRHSDQQDAGSGRVPSSVRFDCGKSRDRKERVDSPGRARSAGSYLCRHSSVTERLCFGIDQGASVDSTAKELVDGPHHQFVERQRPGPR